MKETTTTAKKRSVTDFFRHDHERLDRMLQEFCEARTAGLPSAPGLLLRLQQATHRHLEWENNLTFPLYESRASQAGQRPLADMRAEHEQIQELLATIHRQLADNDPASAAAVTRLGELMEQHHSTEEEIVYDLIDDQLNDVDRAELFARLDERIQAGR